MKTYLHALVMCQSMFCAIPCPVQLWDEKARGKMLLFLPLIGLEIGVLWAAIAWLTDALAIPKLLRGLAVAVWPLLATGWLHLDGLLDVTDAVKSCRDLAKRREILKDSHVGSFAVIGCCLVLLAQFAAGCELPQGRLAGLVLLPAVSRCCSALAVTALRPMSTSQYAAQIIPRGHLWALSAMLLAALAVGFSFGCGVALLACCAGYGLTLWRSYRSLDGMNGDIAGCALTIGELAGMIAYAII